MLLALHRFANHLEIFGKVKPDRMVCNYDMSTAWDALSFSRIRFFIEQNYKRTVLRRLFFYKFKILRQYSRALWVRSVPFVLFSRGSGANLVFSGPFMTASKNYWANKSLVFVVRDACNPWLWNICHTRQCINGAVNYIHFKFFHLNCLLLFFLKVHIRYQWI